MALIDQQEALDALNEYFCRISKLKRRGLNKGEKAISLDVAGAIQSLPTKVICCKDCKYRKICSWKYQGAKFCSFGERGEADGND